MVRLEGPIGCLRMISHLRFNSKMVRLEEARNVLITRKGARFNSKMVRLEGSNVSGNGGDGGKFQFQDGAIRGLALPTISSKP